MRGLSKKKLSKHGENIDTLIIADIYAVYYVSDIVLSTLFELTHLIVTVMLLITAVISSILEMRKRRHKRLSNLAK